MTTFQRARNEDQREIRRQEILDTASAMLREMPVAAISLNELSRRVGLGKPNVLRYFESREAILLELFIRAWDEWLMALPPLFAAGVSLQGSVRQRGDQIACVIAQSLVKREVFCDLFSSHASVLEHNISGEVAARFKRAALANVGALAQLFVAYLPELGEQAWQVCAQLGFAMSAIWVHSRPSAGVLAAAEVDPSLREHRIDFEKALEAMLATLISGTLARADNSSH
ncbi:MAG TPA: TetR family transcriptional regulator [Polyangiaceae bacterium]|nr:TetR family transcriptional regulator [Polyangiaceae bacterium]